MTGVDGPVGRELWSRADRALPGGGIYLTRSADFAGRGVLPGFIASAEGCRVTDVDGRTYLDLVCANGPNLLGYGHPEVVAAAQAQAERAVATTAFPPLLVEVVEALLARRPDMGWGAVAKNGTDVVTLAVRTARRATGRDTVLAFRHAYHGSDAELFPGGPVGVPADRHRDVERLDWNDADALTARADELGERLAAVLLNPLDQNPMQPTREPTDRFLDAVRDVRRRTGCTIVFDDVRHGFRLDPRGSDVPLGLDPDLVCYGKALGNGYSIAAVLGREELRTAAQQIMYTSTAVFEAPPMAAAIATLAVYDRDDAFERIERAGQRLADGLRAAGVATGVPVEVSGPPSMPTLLLGDDPGHERLRGFARRSAELGAIFHPSVNWFLSAAHTDADVDEAVEIAGRALGDLPG